MLRARGSVRVLLLLVCLLALLFSPALAAQQRNAPQVCASTRSTSVGRPALEEARVSVVSALRPAGPRTSRKEQEEAGLHCRP